MKIWKAILLLYSHEGEEYITKFTCKQEKYNYILNVPKDNYICIDNLFADSIPLDIEVKEIYGRYVAKQGFDHEPTANELVYIEQQMRVKIMKLLECNKNIYMNLYEEKMKALK